MLKTSFEKETCSRCGGSGKYSFCQMYRDRCFRCAGAGETLTKRGAAAAAYYNSLCEISAPEVKIGDRIKATSVTNGAQLFSYIATVTDIEVGGFSSTSSLVNGVMVERNVQGITLRTDHPKYGKSAVGVWPDTRLRVYRADDSVRLTQALAYQETLTKTGTVRKTKKQEVTK